MGYLVLKKETPAQSPTDISTGRTAILLDLHEIVVNLGIKEFESIIFSFPSFIPFQSEQLTKEDDEDKKK